MSTDLRGRRLAYITTSNRSGESLDIGTTTLRVATLPRGTARVQRSRELAGMGSFALHRRRFFYSAQALTEYGSETQLREATDPPLTFSR